MKRTLLVLLSLSLLSAPSMAWTPTPEEVAPQIKKLRPAFAPDRLLVKHRAGFDEQDVRVRLAGHGLDHLKSFGGTLGRWRLETVSRYRRIESVLSDLRRDPAIEYAEYDYLYRTTAAPPNDPSFLSQWPLKNTGQSGGVADTDIKATQAWEITKGSPDVVIGVVDTGVDYLHPDLATNVWTNPGEIPGNGVDDDHNGFVDDLHGWNAEAGNGRPLDDNEHGTHVSGTIGAIGDNELGIVGINWDVRIMALKFLDENGSGYLSYAVDCLDYAVTMRNRGVNIRALNASWGGTGNSRALQDAIAAAGNAGILFIAAAGNNGDGSGSAGTNDDLSPIYPAAYDLPNLVSVAAVDRKGNLAGFSNYGARTVALGAPGVSVVSTVPNASYASFSGTSMATPHVTGVVALLAAAAPAASMQQIKDAVLQGVSPLTALQGKTRTGGFLSAMGALSALSPTYSVAADVRAVASPAVATLDSSQPANLTVRCSSIHGFSGDLGLSAEWKPGSDGLTATWSQPSIHLMEDGKTTVICTLSVNDQVPSGEYALSLTGAASDLRRTLTLPVTIRTQGGTIGVSVSPTSRTLARGSIGFFSVSLRRPSNHTLPISLQLASHNGSQALSLLGAYPNPTRSTMAIIFISASRSATPGSVPMVIRATDSKGATADSNQFLVQIQ